MHHYLKFSACWVASVIHFQVLAVIVALVPQSYGGVAYHSVRAAILQHDADALCDWYPLAHAYSNRERLRHLVAFSIPKTQGRLQSLLIDRLTAFGEGAIPFVPMLVRILLDEESKNRNEVAIALGRMGPLAKIAVAPLKDCLKSDEASLRCYACNALWRIEERPASVIPTLLLGLSRKKPPLVNTLRQIAGPDGKLELVGYRNFPMENVEMQFHTLSTIDNIGPKALSVLWPAIANLRDSDDGRITNMVCKLAPKFCPDKNVAAQILSAELGKNGINHNTCDNFKQLGTAVVPELMRLLHEPKTRRAALDVLTALGKDGAMAAKLVGAWIDDPDEASRKRARAALAAFGTGEK